MKYCVYCGTSVTENYKFCPNCGKNIQPKEAEIEETTSAASAPSEETTSIQEEPVSVDTAESVEEAKTETTQIPVSEAPVQKKNSKSLIGIACAVVGVLILAIVVMLQQKKDDSLLPALSDFEALMANAVIDYYDETGIDAAAEGFLLENYKVFDVSDTDTGNERTFMCTYGPNQGINLDGKANSGKVEYVRTFVFFTEEIDENIGELMTPSLMISAGLFDDKYSNMKGIQSLLNKLAQMGTEKEEGDGASVTLIIDDIEYTLYLSKTLLGFEVRAGDAVGSSENVSNPNNDSNAPIRNGGGNTPVAGQTGYAAYDEKIDEYLSAATMSIDKFSTTYTDCSSINALIVGYYHNYGGMSLCYTLYDVDENGVPELIFSDSNNIIDIYTMKNGIIVKLYESCYFGERSRLHILSDGRLLSEGSSGASAGDCEMCLIGSDGVSLTTLCAYYYDGYGRNSYLDPTHSYISSDEYSKMISTWLADSVFDRLSWTVIASN